MRYTRPSGALVFLLAVMAGVTTSQLPASAQSTVRQIPGVTTKDAYPNGCVDCHVAGKTGDMRISVLMAKYADAVPAALIAKAKASSPAALASRIKGKHMPVPNVKANVPQSCMSACHKKGSTVAPPFAQLLHTIHLQGGAQNAFLTTHQGECTHCHKLESNTGLWKIASAAEK
jgi:hypothetical protein